ncbi:hypothetical protein EC973_005011 [Apophysomyces ossiformis]|uniref:NADH:flavin oxidoreductase/NADH oxidase N-terminal domain-containing protein n=1 Tax=Apophysomyces ossiformis TaxID=679940 RepID=A0A8H7EL66_9FUNG|nr:hypothetical protein EC973_005011 [Apophysomyces ossiformis]
MTVAYHACNIEAPPGIPVEPNSPEAKDVLLFQPLSIKSVTLKNRIVVSPMCMYSSPDGILNDFHIAHYGAFALKGAGLVMFEASAVEPRGRVSLYDSGLWSDDHIEPLKRVLDTIKAQGSVAGIQGERKPEDVVGPSTMGYDDTHAQPRALSTSEMQNIITKFAEAAVRADKAGAEIIEIHAAHGYLLHNFLSGHSNTRTDSYGGSLENRMRFPLEVVKAVRAVWPDHKPLWVRLSGTDFRSINTLASDPDGWDIHQSIVFVQKLMELGVDVADCSGGGNLSDVTYPVAPLYQVSLANAVKEKVNIITGTVGLITEPKDAENVLREGKADLVLLGREFLRDSAWTLRAACELGVKVKWANQYERGYRV